MDLTKEQKDEQKAFIDAACKATGLTVEQLGERLDYKSLKRAAWGEIPLPDSKRTHIRDIIQLAALLHDVGHATTKHVEPEIVESGSPRGKLQEALRVRRLSIAQLAKLTKYSSGVLDGVVNGTGRISEKMAEAIVRELPGLSVEELLGGSDTPRVMDESGVTGTVGAKPALDLPGGRTRIVPLLSWASAGALMNAAALDEDFGGDGVASTVPGRAFAVEISGDSMHPEINPGDYAVVRADIEARPGQVVIVRTIHGDVLCKRFTTRDGGRLAVLSSVNSATYQPIEIPADEIAWIYPVKQVIRNY